MLFALKGDSKKDRKTYHPHEQERAIIIAFTLFGRFITVEKTIKKAKNI